MFNKYVLMYWFIPMFKSNFKDHQFEENWTHRFHQQPDPRWQATWKFTLTQAPVVSVIQRYWSEQPISVRPIITSHFISSLWYVSSKLTISLKFYNIHGRAKKHCTYTNAQDDFFLKFRLSGHKLCIPLLCFRKSQLFHFQSILPSRATLTGLWLVTHTTGLQSHSFPWHQQPAPPRLLGASSRPSTSSRSWLNNLDFQYPSFITYVHTYFTNYLIQPNPLHLTHTASLTILYTSRGVMMGGDKLERESYHPCK